MDQLISDLSSHQKFGGSATTIGMDYFACNAVPADNEAAQRRRSAVEDHRNDPAAALDRVVTTSSPRWARPLPLGPGRRSVAPDRGRDRDRRALIAGLLVGFLIVRPRRARRARDLKDYEGRGPVGDLSALNQQITDRDSDVAIQQHPDAAARAGGRAAATAGHRRAGTRRASPRTCRWSAGTSPRRIRLAAAEALANGGPLPDRARRRFFDPRDGMSVADVAWTRRYGVA